MVCLSSVQPRNGKGHCGLVSQLYEGIDLIRTHAASRGLDVGMVNDPLFINGRQLPFRPSGDGGVVAAIRIRRPLSSGIGHELGGPANLVLVVNISAAGSADTDRVIAASMAHVCPRFGQQAWELVGAGQAWRRYCRDTNQAKTATISRLPWESPCSGRNSIRFASSKGKCVRITWPAEARNCR